VSNPVSEDIKDRLVELNLGEFGSSKANEWAIFVSEIPENAPATILVVYDTVGSMQKTYNTEKPFLRCAFQLRCRDTTYLGAREKLMEASVKLNASDTWAVGTMKYKGISFDEEPIPLIRKDEKSRSTWVLNGTAFRQTA